MDGKINLGIALGQDPDGSKVVQLLITAGNAISLLLTH
jgi:hypothetical protein